MKPSQDYDTALAEHFHEFLHEDRYQDAVFCERLRRWQREMPAEGYIRQLQALAQRRHGHTDQRNRVGQ